MKNNLKGYIPTSINLQVLQQWVNEFSTPSNTTLKVDGFIAILSTIILNGVSLPYKHRNGMWKNGWVQVKSKDLKNLVSSNYKTYLDILVQKGIITRKNSYSSGNLDSSNIFAKHYRINGLFDKSNNSIKVEEVFYQDKFVISQIKKKYDKNRTQYQTFKNNIYLDALMKDNPIRIKLLEESIGLFQQMDMKECKTILKSLMEDSQITKKDSRYLTDCLIKLDNASKDVVEFYHNIKDSFGGRFHTVFTNINKALRNAIKFKDGQKGVNIDIKNSQFYFFGVLCKNGLDESLQYEVGNDSYNKSCKHLLEVVKYSYTNHKDTQKFVELSMNGNLYEYVSNKLNIGRSDAKKLLFKILFSSKDEFIFQKRKLIKLFPNVITLFGILNGTKKDGTKVSYGVKFLQKLESFTMIDGLGKSIVESNILMKDHYTFIHDSIICSKSDEKLVLDLLERVEIFKKYPPILAIETL